MLRPINRSVVCNPVTGGSFFIRGCGDDIMSIARLSASATKYPRELGLRPALRIPPESRAMQTNIIGKPLRKGWLL